ncbi:hypothetical protein MXD63_43625, partial [Frankia sp. Cpl3]|nr:hypothetical protein [Frankia sp. Cpl3]
AAAVFSSALFAGSAFAKVDEGNDKEAYVAPAFQFTLPAHQLDNSQPANAAPHVVKEKRHEKE